MHIDFNFILTILNAFTLFLHTPVAKQPNLGLGHNTVQVSRSDTNTNTYTYTHCRTPPNESPTQRTQGTNINAISWIRTHNPTYQANLDLSLRPHDHFPLRQTFAQWNSLTNALTYIHFWHCHKAGSAQNVGPSRSNLHKNGQIFVFPVTTICGNQAPPRRQTGYCKVRGASRK